MTVTLKIEKNVYGGDGLGRLGDGRVCFVPGAFAGETVRAELVDSRKSFVRAVCTGLVEPSPDRIRPLGAAAIKDGIPARARREGGHPARRVFQAVRIAVNGEYEDLTPSVEKMFDALKVGGVLSIITFHSLEDRAVKNAFKKFTEGCTCPKDFPVCVCGKTPRGELQFKSLAPSAEELERNPRSHSARLRSIIKLK